jgi:hypothetical protein
MAKHWKGKEIEVQYRKCFRSEKKKRVAGMPCKQLLCVRCRGMITAFCTSEIRIM